ncbi:MAG: carbohydrate binding domain-containing protein [Bacillota bacterium]|nr:carbohydrate binding domain-containing protein [Bacillota bacterium]
MYQKMNLANGWHTIEIKIIESGAITLDTLTVVDTDDVTPPAQVTGLAAAQNNTAVDLKWTAGSDSDLEGYRVYRSKSPESGFAAVGSNALKLVKGSVSFTDTSLTNGVKYYYVVTAVDKFGNESVPSDVISQIPAALAGIHQENDSGMVYSGSWYQYGDSNTSGSRYAYSNTAGDTASLTFNGTGVKFIATTGTGYGKVDIYIDDILKDTVDLYRPSNGYQNMVWINTPPLPKGIHKITIKNSGTKNSLSSGTAIILDALEIIDSADNTPPGIPEGLTVLFNNNQNYLQWFFGDDDDFYGYNIYRSTSGLEGSFTKISVDPVRFSSTYLDLSINTAAYYRVSAIDKNGNESALSPIVLSTPLASTNLTIEENNALISYTGVWNRTSNSNASGGYQQSTNDKPVKVSYKFYGTGIDFITERTSSSQTIIVKVDGSKPVKVDLYSDPYQAQVPVYRVRNLNLGLHTIEITDSNSNINSNGAALSIDSFRIVDGSDKKPSTPLDLSASPIVNKVKILWSNVQDKDVVGYNVYFKTGALEYKKANLAGIVESGFTHIGLNLSTTYTYIIKAVNAAGIESDASIEVTAKTSESLVKALLQPSYTVEKGMTITINAGNSYSADPPLSYYWDLNGDGNYDDAEGVEIQTAFNTIGDHTVGLKVEDSLHRVDTTTTKVIVTVPTDKTPPTTPTNLTVVTMTGSAVMLSWSPSTDDFGVTGYEIYRDDKKIAEASNATYTDSSVSANTTYIYYVIAKDASGKTSGHSNVVNATPKLPHITNIDPISGTAVGGKTSKTLKVSFADYGGLVGSHAAFEYSTDGLTWTPVDGSINGPTRYDSTTLYFTTTLDLTNMQSGNYILRYSVFDGSDNVDRVTAALRIDRTAPAAPANLKLEPKVGGVDLSWLPTGDDDVAYYNIYRSVSETGTYSKIARVNSSSTLKYSDSTLEDGKISYYKVTAVDRFEQEGSFSNISSGSPVNDKIKPVILGIEPLNDTVIGPNASITVRAEDNLALSKIVLQYSVDGTNWIEIGTQFTKDNAVFKWATSPLNGNVTVRAIAVDSVGNVSDGSDIRSYKVDNQGPGKVTDIKGTSYMTGITLHWSYTPDDDFSYFLVERKDSSDGNYITVGRVDSTLGMNVTGLKADTAYWFKVTTFDKLGNGTTSDEVQIKTLKDTEAPRITGLGPAPAYYANEIQLTASAADNAGVKALTFQVSRDLSSWNDLVTFEDVNAPVNYYASYKLDVSKFTEGVLYIRAIARDSAGNESNKTSSATYAEYRIDHTPPAVTTGLKAESSTGDITLSWTQGKETDLAAYRIYRSTNDNLYDIIADNVSSTAYRDRNVESGVTYYYKVAALDMAGNAGDKSDPVTGKLEQDTKAPSILSISPTKDSILPANPTIYALAEDNYKLASVKMEYKKSDSGNSDWNVIGSQPVSVYSQVVSMKWNTSGLNDGSYTIRVTAYDAAGLQSTPTEITYNINVDPPTAPNLLAVAGGWKSSLSWTSGEEPDLAGFRVYKATTSGGPYSLIKETTGNTFEELGLSPGISVFYVVDAVDIYGNVSRSKEITVIPTNEDIYPPTAVAGNDIQATTGIGVWFDGTLSKDNDRIASFRWDFGDGSSSVEAQPTHIYNTVGKYSVTLTVTDPAGNTNTDTLEVTVVPPTQVGNLEVRVIDDSTGTPITGASIVIQYADGSSKDATTNGEGIANVVAKAGDYKVFAYKTDYKPASTDTKLSADQKTAVTLKLKSGQLVVGDLSVRRLTLDEIKDAGIDVNAPENQYVYKFEVHLAFNNIPLPPANIIVNQVGTIIGDTYKPIIIHDTSTVSGGTPSTYIAYPVAIPNVNHPEVRPTVAYMVIPGEARFLKEIFEVGLSLENTADSQFVIENSKAYLKLPAGLSLAPTREAQSLEVNIGSFAGGEKRQIKWIIRGDQKGSYNLEADFNGILQPFGDPVKATFKTKEPFRVWGDDALKLHIKAQDKAYVGHPYKVTFELENVSDIPVYYPSIELLESSKQNYFYAPNQELEKNVETLPAGQKLVKEYTLVSGLEGQLDLSQSYVLKTGGNVTIPSDISQISVPENYKGTAPTLNEIHNGDGTVTLSWGAVAGASGYKIYSIRKDLYMSIDPDQLIASVNASTTTYTFPETSGKLAYILTTIIDDKEIMRHAIVWPYQKDPAPPVVTVDPETIYAGRSAELLITSNNDGLPVVDGIVKVGSLSAKLDSNGQARITVNPVAIGSLDVQVFDKNGVFLVNKKISVIALPPESQQLINPSFDNNTDGWYFWTQNGALAKGSRDTIINDTPPASYRIDCVSPGTNPSDIQLYTFGLSIEAGKTYELSFRARSEGGIIIPDIKLMKRITPWTSYSDSDSVTIGNDWSTYKVYFKANYTDVDARITFFLGNKIPQGSKLFIDTLSLTEAKKEQLPPGELLKNPSFSYGTDDWYLCTVDGKVASGKRDNVTFDTFPASYKIDSISESKVASDIQLFTTGINIEAGKWYELSFKAKSDGGNANPLISLMKASSPWSLYSESVSITTNNSWTTYKVCFKANTTDNNARITFFLGGRIPVGVKFYVDSLSFAEAQVPQEKPDELLTNPSFTYDANGWFLSTIASNVAKGSRNTIEYDTLPACYTLDCMIKGTKLSDIQLYTFGLNIKAGKKYELSFRAKSDKGTLNPEISLMKKTSPWTLYSTSANVNIGPSWTTYKVYFESSSTDTDARITFYLGNRMLQGEKLYLDSLSFVEVN